ncbi:MAG: hypothetical protein ACRCYY_18815 [Trueperaceae bacterium]
MASAEFDLSALGEGGSALQLTVAGEAKALGLFFIKDDEPRIGLQTLDGTNLSCNATEIAETQPKSQSNASQSTTPTSALTTTQLADMGIDPETMLVPDRFHCYEEVESDDYSHYSFELTLMQGNRYTLG